MPTDTKTKTIVESPPNPRNDPRFTENKPTPSKTPSEEIPLAKDNSGNYFENHPGGNPPPVVEPDLTKNPASNPDNPDYDESKDPLRDANKVREQIKKNKEAVVVEKK